MKQMTNTFRTIFCSSLMCLIPALVFDSRMKTAGHWQKKDLPMSNLYLGLLQQFGAEQDRFGESTAAFEVLT